MNVSNRVIRNVVRQWSAIVLAGALATPASAQLMPTTMLASTLPSTSPAPALDSPRSPLGHPATTQISFNFKDASIDTVLDHLSEVAGFVIVREAPITGRVTVLSKQPVTPTEAVSLLNSVLKNQNYTIVQMGRILKIVSRDKAKKGNIPVHFGADPETIDDSDELITQVIPVRSVDAVKLKTDLAPLISSDADLASNAGSNTIIMTDTSSNIRRIATIIQNMDKRDATQAAIHVKQLKYADATAAAKLINDIFNPTTTAAQTPFNPAQFFGRGRGGGGFGGGFGGGGGGQQTQDEDKGNTGKITASADTRTNTVVVTGPEDTLAVIDGVLAQLDANPSEDSSFFIYHVKNGQSVDMANTLNSLFGNSTSSTSSTNGNNASRTTNGTTSSGSRSSPTGGGGIGSSGSSSSSLGGSGSINRSFNNGSSSTGGGGNNGGNRGGNGNGATGTNGSTSIVAQLQGQVNVVADQDTNTLLVACASKYQDQLKSIIAELDRPVQQVLIKVLIAEVTHDNSSDLGLDFSVLNLRPSGNGQNLVSNLGNAAAQTANGGLAVSVLENNLTATFHALAVQGRLDVLSRPYILTSDNQEANILVGQQYPFITDTRTTDTGETINTVNYQNIGISLDVTPHINPDGLVILDVSPQIGDVADTSITITSGVTSPVFDTRTASSRVGVRDGDTIVIGGLMQDQKTQTINKVPILGDIPYLGVLFSRNSVTKTKTELLIFLTPHVAPLPSSLPSMARSETSNLKIAPSAVEPGTFQDHLHGMQLGARESTTAPMLTAPPATKPTGDAFPEPGLPGDHTTEPLTGQQRLK